MQMETLATVFTELIIPRTSSNVEMHIWKLNTSFVLYCCLMDRRGNWPIRSSLFIFMKLSLVSGLGFMICLIKFWLMAYISLAEHAVWLNDKIYTWPCWAQLSDRLHYQCFCLTNASHQGVHNLGYEKKHTNTPTRFNQLNQLWHFQGYLSAFLRNYNESKACWLLISVVALDLSNVLSFQRSLTHQGPDLQLWLVNRDPFVSADQ